MSKKNTINNILLTTTQSPSNGGAATNIYKLHKFLLNNNIKSYCIFFFSKNEESNPNVDPDNVGHTDYLNIKYQTASISDSSDKISNIKKKLNIYFNGEPNLILSKNLLAPIISKSIYPNSKLVYLVSGIHILTLLNKYRTIIATDFINNFQKYKKPIFFKKVTDLYARYEKKTLEISDEIIVNSNLTKTIMQLIYPEFNFTKIIDTSLVSISKYNLIPFNKKEYDIIFVCSNFNRIIKNSQLINKIFLDKRTYNLKKVCIGNNNIFSNEIKNLTVLSKLSNLEVINYLSKSKIVLIPSLFDSSPNIFYEGISCGCNIITTKNVGNSSYLDKESIVNDINNINEWINKIFSNLNTSNEISINKNNLLKDIINLIK